MSPVQTASPPPVLDMDELRETYQSAVAGTFYRTMLKSLRGSENKPAYLHGGMTEDIFRSRLDDQLSEILADSHGSAFSQPLFEQLAHKLTGKIPAASRTPTPETQTLNVVL